jgi:UDP:flavonoid glycosyltransferase YjiC (YdhE family)
LDVVSTDSKTDMEFCRAGPRFPPVEASMRYLLTPIGSLGDVNPFLGIGRELVRRGHEALVLANPKFERAVGEAELPFVPVGTAAELDEFWRHPDMWRLHGFWKTALDYSALRPMRPTYEAILRHHDPGRTVLVAPAWGFAARIARETLRIPLATVHLETYLLRSALRSSRMPRPLLMHDWVPRHCKRLQFWVADRFFIDRCLAGEANGFRRELGLPPVRRFMHQWWHSPDLLLCMFPDWFCAPQADWPASTLGTHLCGFGTWDGVKSLELTPEAEDFLAAGSPPIVFTAGTVNQQAKRFFTAAVGACRRIGWRGMLMSRYPEQLSAAATAEVRPFSFLPFLTLLPRCAALVHHGGLGTMARAFAAGIPQVITPMSFSQPDVAARM